MDYLYLDGDHSKGASLQYFELCLAKAHSKSVFIIADIHWSAHMEEAWEEIKDHFSEDLSKIILEVKERCNKNYKIEQKSPEEIEFNRRLSLLKQQQEEQSSKDMW